MPPKVIVLIAILLGSLSAENIYPGTLLIIRNITLPANNPQYPNTLVVPNSTSLYVYTIPCFGKYDWYANLGNVTTDAAPQTFSDGGALSEWSVTVKVIDFYVGILAVGKNTYGDLSALFDLLVATDEIDSTVIPDPGNGRNVNGQNAKDGKSGTLSWTGTGNSQDNYTLYYRNGQATDGGYFPYTACGVRLYMSPFTSTQGSFKSNGDGTYTANVINLDPNQPFAVTVVVDRSGGYSSAYDTFVFNSVVLLIALFSILV